MPRKDEDSHLPYVLIAEDDPEVRNMVVFWLKQHDYSVAAVADGLQALELIRETHPDAVVLDWMMPGIEGHEVCRQLKDDKETEDISIVMLTAKGKEADVTAAFERGADEYLTKPFDMAELDHILRRLLDRE